MTDLQPPRLPKWFLDHLTSAPYRDALIGDLNEEFAHRQSAFWYVRQVGAAILLGPMRFFALMCLLGMPLCTLIGGLIAARGTEQQRQQSESYRS